MVRDDATCKCRGDLDYDAIRAYDGTSKAIGVHFSDLTCITGRFGGAVGRRGVTCSGRAKCHSAPGELEVGAGALKNFGLQCPQ